MSSSILESDSFLSIFENGLLDTYIYIYILFFFCWKIEKRFIRQVLDLVSYNVSNRLINSLQM